MIVGVTATKLFFHCNLENMNCQFFHNKHEQFKVQKTHQSKEGCHGNISRLDMHSEAKMKLDELGC